MNQKTTKKMKPQIKLSKSKIKEMEGCDLMLFNTLNASKEKKWDKSNLFRFEQGRAVEQLARDKFPGGVLMNRVANYDKVLYTRELLANPEVTVIFEASFASKNTIIMFDVLIKNADGTFDAIEVKSATKFKPEYETDVLVQYWIASRAGIKINKFSLWFVNTQSTGMVDYFTETDVTEIAKKGERKFWTLLYRALAILDLEVAPEVKRGPHCDKLECPYRNTVKCALAKTEGSVLDLPHFTQGWKALDKGITSVNDEKFEETYPKYVKENPIVIEAIKTNKLVVNRDGLLADYANWKFPLNFFDFETLMSALPVLEKQRPYEQVAFQFSNHVFDGVKNKMDHTAFIHNSTSSPDRPMIEAILSTLEKNNGSIVSYNKSFEQSRIRELAVKSPEYSVRLLAIVDRFVDLMDLVKDHVYHPSFKGSYSLKVVSPTLLGEYGSYSDSLIKSGSEIAEYYMEMIKTNDKVRAGLIYSALDKYCFYDTLNLFLVLQFLIDPKADIKNLVEVNLATPVVKTSMLQNLVTKLKNLFGMAK